MAAVSQPTRSSPAAQPLIGGLRLWLLLDTALVLTAGFQLFVLSAATDRFFAWTIAPPLTAAFLGACYFASAPLVFVASRRAQWAQSRLAIFGVLVFTTLTLFATLFHLDRFHLFSAVLTARVAAWAWLIVYALVPPALALLVLVQLLQPGGDPPRSAPMPAVFRLVLAAQAAVMLLLGALLFALPTLPLWPWALTPLTGRAVGAWLVGIGVIAAHMGWEGDWSRIQPGLLAYSLLALLQLVNLLRFSGALAGFSPQTILYLLFLLSILVMGSVGAWAPGARPRPGQG